MTPPLLTHSPEQAQLWLRGLLTMAWADGHYDAAEQTLIESLLHEDLGHLGSPASLEPISADALAQALDPREGEDFLRILVMVGLADGVYSEAEDRILQEFSQALNITIPSLAELQKTLTVTGSHSQPMQSEPVQRPAGLHPSDPTGSDVLDPLRHWLDSVDVNNRRVAHFLCKMIPAQCPFERDVVLFNHKVFHIPPMCKLNPLYDQVVGLRFRALSFLADKCHEDIRPYI